MGDYIIVLSTVPDKETGEKIANKLVEQKIAACVNIVPEIISTFLWKGNVDKITEALLIIKTRKDLYGEVERIIKENHPYEIPEVLAIEITSGYTKYFEWMDQEMGKK